MEFFGLTGPSADDRATTTTTKRPRRPPPPPDEPFALTLPLDAAAAARRTFGAHHKEMSKC